MEYYTQPEWNHETIHQLRAPWHWAVTDKEYIPATDQTRISTINGWEGEIYPDTLLVDGDRTADPEDALIDENNNYLDSTGPHGPVGVGGGGFPKKH